MNSKNSELENDLKIVLENMFFFKLLNDGVTSLTAIRKNYAEGGTPPSSLSRIMKHFSELKTSLYTIEDETVELNKDRFNEVIDYMKKEYFDFSYNADSFLASSSENNNLIFDEDGQTYKSVYEKLLEESEGFSNAITALENEKSDLLSDYQSLKEEYDNLQLEFENHAAEPSEEMIEKNEYVRLQNSYDELQKEKNTLNYELAKLRKEKLLKTSMEDVPIPKNVKIYNSNGVEFQDIDSPDSLFETTFAPASEGFRRPSYFKEVGKVYSNENNSKEIFNETKMELENRISLFDKLRKDTTKSAVQKNDEIELDRQKKVQKLLSKECEFDNQAKLSYYALITPTMPKYIVSLLQKAIENGVDANILITLMEVPEESFRFEIVENYISIAHKNNAANLKLELAKDLIAGKWYIEAKNQNGQKERYQLFPMSEIKEFHESLLQKKNSLSSQNIKDINEEEYEEDEHEEEEV